MRFIGGGTRCEWWFASQRLTVIEQSTASETAAHTAKETVFFVCVFKGLKDCVKNLPERGALD